MERLFNVSNLYDLLASEDLEEDVMICLLCQLFQIVLLFQKWKVCHYDMHFENILVCQCDTRTVLEYGSVRIPTHGYLLKVIDFGFAFIDTGTPQPLLSSSIEFSDQGIFPDRIDPIRDVLRVVIEMEDFKGRWMKWVKLILKPIPKHLRQTGLEKGHQNSLAHRIYAFTFDESSKLFGTDKWIEIVQCAITVPFEATIPSLKHLSHEPFRQFDIEWSCLDTYIEDTLPILSIFVDIYVGIRPVLLGISFTQGIQEMGRMFHDQTSEYEYLCPNWNFDHLVSAFVLMMRQIEGICYYSMKDKVASQRSWAKHIKPASVIVQSFMDQFGKRMPFPDEIIIETIN